MCIIVYKPKNKQVKKTVLETCFESNPDGAGFIIREDSGELLLKKGFFTFESFWEEYKRYTNKQAIIHFRIRTHGDKDTENCHPFWMVENKIAFAHNGVIHNVKITDTSKSDTWTFNVSILKELENKFGPQFLEDPVMQILISNYVGYSRLVFLNELGKVLIFNKAAGEEVDGVWFSNNSYKDTKSHSSFTKEWDFSNKKWVERKKKKGKFFSSENFWSKDKKEETNNISRTNSTFIPESYWDRANREAIEKAAKIPIEAPERKLLSFTPRGRAPKIGDFIQINTNWRDTLKGQIGKVWSIRPNSMFDVKIFDHTKPEGFYIRCVPETVLKFSSSSA